jgi:ABC-type bacteriocin/lantibiotic exporter with double-glycine peptidase domain
MEEAKRKILWKNKRLQVPAVLQMEATDCGAASIAMILSYHKRFMPLEQLRADCGVSRDGSSALNIVKTARKYGLEARGFSIETDNLSSIQLPMVLHWNFNHFLVLEGRKGNTFYLNDPACGPRTVSLEEFDCSFTGLALQFIPGANFQPEQTPVSFYRALTAYFQKSRAAISYILLCSILLAIPGIIIPSLSMIFVDRILGQKTGLMLPLLLALGLALLMKAYITWLQRTAILKLSVKFLVSSAAALFEHMLKLPAEFYHQRTPGELQYRLTLNNHPANLISGPAGEAFSNLMVASFFLIIMFQYDIPLALAGGYAGH